MADVVTGNLHSSLWLKSNEPAKAFKNLCKKLTYIEAAGGLVKNEFDEYLTIFRLGKWDLPKGKLEDGEEIPECAVREVKEECGVTVARIIEELPSSYHVYVFKDQLTLKRTYWFSMECLGRPELTPQTEEDIAEVRWVKKDDFALIYENTYPAIMDVLSLVSIR
ncbi:NUDIX domain-containing protein [Solitalea koreensis]|uniref:NUDIX domain-containing protein n=2 Tax=Solitalea koreensis TaxID=543615 RepID=A0A521D284_9SPHI|nr:NUDIX domain-containing protein [Solitalea koreensis]